MQMPKVDEATIKQSTEEGSFARGRQYFEEGAVLQIEHQADGVLEAQVQGSQLVPYTVHIEYDQDDVEAATCSCPYHGGSWCKHIAATLLACLNQSGRDVQESVRASLSGLTRQQIVELVERLAVREPALAEWIEREVPLDER